MTLFLSYLINGISLGSVYAIIALGYTMVYGIAKMLNFAHGDVIMIGADICVCAAQYRSAGTCISPIEPRSTRYSICVLLLSNRARRRGAAARSMLVRCQMSSCAITFFRALALL